MQASFFFGDQKGPKPETIGQASLVARTLDE